MKKLSLLGLLIFFGSVCLFSQESPKTDEGLSPYLFDGKRASRILVAKVKDSKGADVKIYDCVSELGNNAKHMYYELECVGVKDNRYSYTWTESDGYISFHVGGRKYEQSTSNFLFLGFTKEQALESLESFYDAKKIGKRLFTAIQHQAKFASAVYRFKGINTLLPEGEEDVTFLQYTTDIGGFFQIRTKYSEKSYIMMNTMKELLSKLNEYVPLKVNDACVGTPMSDVIDNTDVCHWKRLGVRIAGFGIYLSDYQVYECDNPLFPDEKYCVLAWTHQDGDILPLGATKEAVSRNINDMQIAFKYVMDNRCGEVVMKKLIAPEYEVKIGDCYYLLSKVNGEKTCWIIPCRFGCRSMGLNKTCLNEINKYVQNSK